MGHLACLFSTLLFSSLLSTDSEHLIGRERKAQGQLMWHLLCLYSILQAFITLIQTHMAVIHGIGHRPVLMASTDRESVPSSNHVTSCLAIFNSSGSYQFCSDTHRSNRGLLRQVLFWQPASHWQKKSQVQIPSQLLRLSSILKVVLFRHTQK